MKRCIFTAIVTVFALTSTGCTMLDASRDAFVQTTRMMRPRPHDGPAKQKDAEDEWGFVGTEGRAGQERERDPDPWYKQGVMSEEARNIERNLGID